MKNYTVRPYQWGDYEIWNAFLANAKNATFLFHRDFMEYHSDRFNDFSLLVFDDKKLVALLPGNKKDDVVYSHQGLTYGGLIYGENKVFLELDQIFDAILQYLKEKGIQQFGVKLQPIFYRSKVSLEIDFLMTSKEALIKREMSLAVNLADFTISKSKMKHYRRISKLGLEIRKEQSFNLFWDAVLIPRLKQKHNASPVHSKEEIAYLSAKFPSNIFQYNVYLDGEILAGVTVFLSGKIVKSQYGATTENGEKYRALDYLFINLLQDFKQDYSFFDMGTVTENNQKGFNQGLLQQKQELGCSIYSQDFYLLSL